MSFWLHGCCGEWEGGSVNQVNNTSWVAVVTPTYRPKSVRDCCLIELFCGVVCVVTFPFDISVGVGAFVIGLGQISSFLSLPALVPYRLAGGDSVCSLYVSLSVRHCPSVRQFVPLRFSGLFYVVFWDIYLKFDIYICHGIIQIKYEFSHAWATFTGVIALCLNLVFRTFLCRLLRYWLATWYIWIYHDIIIQIKFEFCHAWPTFTGVIALF